LILSSDRKLVLWEFKCSVSVSADPGADDGQTGSYIEGQTTEIDLGGRR